MRVSASTVARWITVGVFATVLIAYLFVSAPRPQTHPHHSRYQLTDAHRAYIVRNKVSLDARSRDFDARLARDLLKAQKNAARNH